MAKGYPDFFGISIFPQYSAYQVDRQAPIDIVGGGSANLWTINTRAELFGGWIRFITTSDPPECTVIMTADGSDLIIFDFALSMKYGLIQPFKAPIVLSRYDRAEKEYGVVIQSIVRFESSLVISMSSWGVEDLTGWGEIYYAKIT